MLRIRRIEIAGIALALLAMPASAQERPRSYLETYGEAQCVAGKIRGAIRSYLPSAVAHLAGAGAAVLLTQPLPSPPKADPRAEPSQKKKDKKPGKLVNSSAQDKPPTSLASILPPAPALKPAKPPDVLLKTREELIAEAKTALQTWLTTGTSPPVTADFLMQADNLERPRSEAQFAINSSAGNFKEILGGIQNSLSSHPGDFDGARLTLAPTLSPYCAGYGRISDLFEDHCGNCEAETKLVLAAMMESKAPLPAGTVLGVQVFNGHIQPVLYNAAERSAQSLVSGDVFEQPPLGAVYSPALFFYQFLRQNDEPASPELVAKLTLDPGAPAPSAEGPLSVEDTGSGDAGGMGETFDSKWNYGAFMNGQKFTGGSSPRFGQINMGSLSRRGGTGRVAPPEDSDTLVSNALAPSPTIFLARPPNDIATTGFGFNPSEMTVLLDRRPTVAELAAKGRWQATKNSQGEWLAQSRDFAATDPHDVATLERLGSFGQQLSYVERRIEENLERLRKGRDFQTLLRYFREPDLFATAPAAENRKTLDVFQKIVVAYTEPIDPVLHDPAALRQYHAQPIFQDLLTAMKSFAQRLDSRPEPVIQHMDSLSQEQRQQLLNTLGILHESAIKLADRDTPMGELFPNIVAMAADPKKVGIVGEEDDLKLAPPLKYPRAVWICTNPAECRDWNKGIPRAPDDQRANYQNGEDKDTTHGKPTDQAPDLAVSANQPSQFQIKPETMVELVLNLGEVDGSPNYRMPEGYLTGRWNKDLQQHYTDGYERTGSYRELYLRSVGRILYDQDLLSLPPSELKRKYGDEPWKLVYFRLGQQVLEAQYGAGLTTEADVLHYVKDTEIPALAHLPLPALWVPASIADSIVRCFPAFPGYKTKPALPPWQIHVPPPKAPTGVCPIGTHSIDGTCAPPGLASPPTPPTGAGTAPSP